RTGPRSRWSLCARRSRRSWFRYVDVAHELVWHLPGLTEQVVSADIRDHEPAPPRDDPLLVAVASGPNPLIAEARHNGADFRRKGESSDRTELSSLHERFIRPRLPVGKLRTSRPQPEHLPDGCVKFSEVPHKLDVALPLFVTAPPLEFTFRFEPPRDDGGDQATDAEAAEKGDKYVHVAPFAPRGSTVSGRQRSKFSLRGLSLLISASTPSHIA